MTSGKAGGLLGERLKGANKTLSRLRRLWLLLPLQRGGRPGMGASNCGRRTFDVATPTRTLPLFKEEGRVLATFIDRGIGQTSLSPPAKPGVYQF